MTQTVHTDDITLNKVLEKRMPNVIYLIGDGLGPEELKLASLVEYGTENGTIIDTDFPIQSLYTTNDILDRTTDSAAAGSALATGQLTRNAIISMDPTKSIPYKTILEYLQYDFGYATGIITTTTSTHATPATFATHAGSREDENEIRDQMQGKNIDLILGMGLEGVSLGPNIETARGRGELNGYTVVVNLDELNSQAQTANKLLGVFPGVDGERGVFELNRIPTIPSLIDMAKAGLSFLERKSNPYFVMIEAGNIDQAGHVNENLDDAGPNKTLHNVLQTINFEKTVRLALDIAKADGNTIVIVAADHETGDLSINDFSGLDNILPSETNDRDTNIAIRAKRLSQIDASFPLNFDAHTKTPVRFAGYGSDFGSLNVTRIDDIFWALNSGLGSFPGVLNHRFTINGDMLDVVAEVRDLDKSAEIFSVVIEYGNGTVKIYNYEMPVQEITSYSVSVPLDTAQTYLAYIRISDNGTNDILSFDSNSKLVQQEVTHPLLESTTTEATTSQTTTSNTIDPISTISTSSITEDSKEDNTPIVTSFAVLAFATIVIIKRIPKKEN